MIKNNSKCVKCVRRDRFCVSAFWKSLDQIRNKLKFDIIVIEKKLVRILIKLIRLKKTLKHTKFIIAEKSACLAQELIDDNNDVSSDETSSVFFW